MMNLKPSTALRNEYQQAATLAKSSGEPIIITNKGEADLVLLSVEAYEEREKCWITAQAFWRQSIPDWLALPLIALRKYAAA